MNPVFRQPRVYRHEWLFAVILCLLVLGVLFLNSLSNSLFDKVQEGWTPSQVHQFLGNPIKQTADVWEYENPDGKRLRLVFQNGVVSEKSTD